MKANSILDTIGNTPHIRMAKLFPDAEVWTYPAGHAFDREVDSHAFDAPSAKLALDRTLAFFARNLGGA